MDETREKSAVSISNMNSEKSFKEAIVCIVTIFLVVVCSWSAYSFFKREQSISDRSNWASVAQGPMSMINSLADEGSFLEIHNIPSEIRTGHGCLLQVPSFDSERALVLLSSRRLNGIEIIQPDAEGPEDD